MKTQLNTAYGHLSDPISSILTELNQKTDENNDPLKFKWTFARKDYRNAYSKARTRTAPGFSGMTTSLWKPTVDNVILASIYAKLMQLPSKYGFSYPRWEVSIQAMLKKRVTLLKQAVHHRTV